MTPKRHRALPATVLLVGATLGLAGCGASPAPDSDSPGPISVVASTSVYGDIAQQVGGDLITVTSIIDRPDQDPHEYEADARSQLELSKADVVIENGGGYDDFVNTMLSASNNDDVARVNVSDISGYAQEPGDDAFNEHVWYDFPTMEKFTNALADTFTSLDPDGTEAFRSNADEFNASLSELEAQLANMSGELAGLGLVATEPLPLYLTSAVGLVDETPATFTRAVEAGTGIPPAVLRDTLALFTSGSVDVLIYNPQTRDSQTETILAAAAENGIPVTAMTELPPADTGYLEWMTANVDALRTALEKSARP